MESGALGNGLGASVPWPLCRHLATRHLAEVSALLPFRKEEVNILAGKECMGEGGRDRTKAQVTGLLWTGNGEEDGQGVWTGRSQGN